MGALPPGHIDQYGNQEFAFGSSSSESSSAPPAQAGQQVNIEVKKNKGRRRRLPAHPLHEMIDFHMADDSSESDDLVRDVQNCEYRPEDLIDFEMSDDDNSSSEGPRAPFVKLPRRDRLRRAKQPAQKFGWKYLVVPVV